MNEKPKKKRGVKKGTKLTSKQKQAKKEHTVRSQPICEKCGGKGDAHSLRCVKLQLPKKKNNNGK